MNWHDVVKSSETYWKPKASSWNFCGFCCTDTMKPEKPAEPDPAKHAQYSKTKKVTYYWSKEDENKLIKLASKYNCDWEIISKKFSDKTAAQLSHRWKNKLDPGIKKSPFTEEEDVALKALVLEIGYEWESISKYLQGRPARALKKRFFQCIAPVLSIREQQLLQERLKPKAEEIDSMMEIDEVNDANKEEHLHLLRNRVDSLQNLMQATIEQIETLEKELNDNRNLLS